MRKAYGAGFRLGRIVASLLGIERPPQHNPPPPASAPFALEIGHRLQRRWQEKGKAPAGLISANGDLLEISADCVLSRRSGQWQAGHHFNLSELRAMRKRDATAMPSFEPGTHFYDVEDILVSTSPRFASTAWDVAAGRPFPTDSAWRNGRTMGEAEFREMLAASGRFRPAPKPGSVKEVGALLSAAIVQGLNEHVMECYGGIYEKDLLPGFPPYGGYSDSEIAESKRRAAELLARVAN